MGIIYSGQTIINSIIDGSSEFQKGSEVWWTHRWDPLKDRGPVYGYYAGYTLKDGGGNFEFMSVPEIEAHRDQYSQGAYKRERGKFVLDESGKKIPQGPWKDSPDWMCRKTPLIKVLKLAPKSIEMRTAMTLSGQAEAGAAQTFVDLPKELNPVPMDPPDEISAPQPADAPKPEGAGIILISDVQVKRLETIAEESGWRQADVLALLGKKYSLASVTDIRAIDYDKIIEILKAGGEPPA
jgi:recombinational DNA repair protein RecT